MDFELVSGCNFGWLFVGLSGAAKKTVAGLVIGLFQPQKGEVRIDNVTLSRSDMRSMRQINDYAWETLLLLEIA
jgi:ABC-type bacteriocin/lantibiotic exporter with double-glycine peptidase domain